MAQVYNNILETIGGTPLVRLNRLNEGLGAKILVKVESFNPANSSESRTASVTQLSMPLRRPGSTARRHHRRSTPPAIPASPSRSPALLGATRLF